jgi:hypothetical protein
MVNARLNDFNVYTPNRELGSRLAAPAVAAA